MCLSLLSLPPLVICELLPVFFLCFVFPACLLCLNLPVYENFALLCLPARPHCLVLRTSLSFLLFLPLLAPCLPALLSIALVCLLRVF
jgi:hypothetical protein